MAQMKQVTRINQIYDVLKEKGNASTRYLCSLFGVSESTIRRDIEVLSAEQEDVNRVHGGVVLDSDRAGLEYMFELKVNFNAEYKRRIAGVAIELIQDGDTFILDSGSTCLEVARQLHKRQKLRVVTTDIKIAEELGKHESIETYVTGGAVRPGYYTLGDSIAAEVLDHFRVGRAIMSADGIDIEKGITNITTFEVGVKKKIIDMCDDIVLVADHTKFGKTSFYRIADLSSISTIVTTADIDPQIRREIEAMGIPLRLA
jgi:DeoR/GlpR family transcriptional regulator of sugar metabolism